MKSNKNKKRLICIVTFIITITISIIATHAISNQVDIDTERTTEMTHSDMINVMSPSEACQTTYIEESTKSHKSSSTFSVEIEPSETKSDANIDTELIKTQVTSSNTDIDSEKSVESSKPAKAKPVVESLKPDIESLKPNNNTTETNTSATDEVEDTNKFSDEDVAVEEEPVYEYSWSFDGENWHFEPSGWTISNSDWIVLCNCVANEAGSYWITEADKARVCEVIFNRYHWWGYNSIYDVIAAPNQFEGSDGYINLEEYSYKVTDQVINGCAFYCSWPDVFNEGYLFFTGDGYQNHFR